MKPKIFKNNLQVDDSLKYYCNDKIYKGFRLHVEIKLHE